MDNYFLVDVTISLSTWKPTGRPIVAHDQTRGSTTSTFDTILGKTRGCKGIFWFWGRRDEADRSSTAWIFSRAQFYVRPWDNVHVTLSAASWTSWLFDQYVGRKEEKEPDVHRSGDGSAQTRSLVHSQYSSQSRGKLYVRRCFNYRHINLSCLILIQYDPVPFQ